MNDFKYDLKKSLYVQRLLPLHKERSLEAGFASKKPVQTIALNAVPAGSPDSPGTITAAEGGFEIAAPVRRECWPEGMPQNGDYTNWGQADALFERGIADWSRMNRLRFRVTVTLPGAAVAVVNAGIRMENGDAYMREGESTFNVSVGAETECFYEFPELHMEHAKAVRLYVLLNGCDTVTGPEIRVRFRDVRLERIEKTEPFEGWETDRIVFPLAGYLADGKKTAVAPWKGEKKLTVVNAAGKKVLSAVPERITNEKGDFALLDLSGIRSEGEYTLQYAGLTADFSVGSFLNEALWKSVNFLYGERCGYPVPGRHFACHMDMAAHHNGLSVSYAGGWHDAGDVSQQTLQTGEIALALLEAADRLRADSTLGRRLAVEAEWGMDFVLRTRFGDGYRATSAGATRWTDNRAGNEDDVDIRVHDHPFENILFAGIEAAAARILRKYDAGKADGILPIAKEDFEYGLRAYEERGMQLPSFFEHSYNSSRSLYDAAAAWAAGQLCLASREEEYSRIMEKYLTRMLACQETDGPLPGPFYRDETHRMLVHFNHQSREHLFIDALTVAIGILPEREDWKRSARLYADYLKKLSTYAAPYGMLPAGLHHKDEPEMREEFGLCHLMVDYETEKPHYVAQLESGIPLDDRNVIRMFPVWFSFRGNSAVHLSEGIAAAKLAGLFDDAELRDIAREQLYWVLGKNPFSQSLQYGMGSRYCSQYAVFPGELAGEMPVGIETRGDSDLPFWPQGNNATYKEVWTSSVGRWVALIAALS